MRYRDGDYNETVYIKGDGNASPAKPEETIALSKRKFGVDNEKSRSQFLREVSNPLMESGRIYRDGKTKSPNSLIKIR